MIVCNGIQKSGTHALVKAVQLLGQQTQHGHWRHGEAPEGKQVVIFRNPRDVLVSWARFSNPDGATKGYVIRGMHEFNGTIKEEYDAFEPYLDSGVLVVRFERLFKGDGEIRKIAEYIGVPYLDDAFKHLWGLTHTFTGRHSDWTQYWDEHVQAAWENIGGMELDAKWNY